MMQTNDQGNSYLLTCYLTEKKGVAPVPYSWLLPYTNWFP